MPAITGSGEISLSDMRTNRLSAPSAGDDVKLSVESIAFASASVVSPLNLTKRDALQASPYALSEFYGANFPSSIITDISFTTAGGGSDTNTVDGESLTVTFTTDGDYSGDTFTVRALDSSNNTDLSTTRSGAGSVTFSSLALTVDTYTPQVEFDTFNVVNDDTSFTHHDAIGAVTITDPADTTVASAAGTNNITHARSIANTNSLNDYNWSFAKSSGDGSNPSPTTSTASTPTVTYTGPGIYTADLRVDGTPSQARNSTTATQVSHRIDYTRAVSIGDPSSLNEGSTINTSVTHQGFITGVDVDLIRASDNAVLLSNDHTTDSRIVKVIGQNQSFTAPAQTTSTLSVKVKAFDGSDSDTSAAFNIYPLINDEFANGDISAPSAVEVNSNATLSVSGVTDNLVGFAWRLVSGAGSMTAQAGYSNSGGDTDGTSSDATSLINTSDVTNVVRFDTVQQGKTIGLILYGRINQTSTERTATIDVELADAISINSISDTNSPNAITVSGNHSGFQNGVTAGFVLSSNTTSFVQSTEETTNPDSRFTQQSFSENFTPADQITTQTLQGRVVADVDGDSANTSTFSYFPELKNTRNVINPNRNTIYSTTNNNDTGNYPTSVSYSTPSTATDNVTSRTYSTTALTGHTFGNGSATSHAATTTTYGGGTAIGSRTVTLAIEGDSSQTSSTTHAVTINYMPRIYDVTFTTGNLSNGDFIVNSSTISITGVKWQGSACATFHLAVNSTSTPRNEPDGPNGTNNVVVLSGTTLTNGILDGNTGGVQVGGPNCQWSGNISLGTVDTTGTFDVVAEPISESPTMSTGVASTQLTVLGWNTVSITYRVGGSWTHPEDALNLEGGSFASFTKYYLGTLGVGTDLKNSEDASDNYNGGGTYYKITGYVLKISSTGNVDEYILNANVPPKNPTGLTFGSVTSTSFTVNFTDNSTIEDGYRIYVHTSATGLVAAGNLEYTITDVGELPQTINSIDGSSLTAGTTYHVAVVGFNGTGTSDALTGSVTTLAATSWSSVFASFTDSGGSPSTTRTTAAKTLVLNNGSGNTTISRTTSNGITVAYSTNGGASYSGFSSSHTFSFTSGTLYVKFQKTFSKLGGSFTDTFRFTNNSVSVDRNVTMQAFN